MTVKRLLRLEGWAVLTLALYFYQMLDFSWLWFFILLFVPDLSILGYLINARIGAVIYNVFHTYTVPVVLVTVTFMFAIKLLLLISLVWCAHIGMDRLFGFGLKYKTSFHDTHMQKV